MSAVRLSDEQRIDWLRLIRTEGVGPRTFRALVNRFGGARAALEALPDLGARAGRAPIRPVSRAEAERRAGHEVRVPQALGPPDALYVRRAFPVEVVSLVYAAGDRPRYVLTQFRGGLREVLVKKLVEPGTRVVPVTLAGAPGYWVEGAPHGVAWVDEDGMVHEDELALAGNVLLWEDGDLTLRLEGAETLREALRVAASAD